MRYRVSVDGWGNALTTAHLTHEEAEQHIAESIRLNPHHDADGYKITEHDEPSRPCIYCGGEIVNDKDAECDFCRSCFYTGRAFSMQHGETCRRLSGILGREVSVWHTGGGCFSFGAVVDPDGGEYNEILIAVDADVDGDPDEPIWGYSVQRSEKDDGYGEYGDLTLWEAADRARKVADMAHEEYERLAASAS